MGDDAAEWVQEPRNEEIMKFEGDDYWEKETDRWHNKTIEEFFHRLDKWLHPSFNASRLGEENAAKFISVHESSQFYTNTSSLFLELRKARADLDVDAAKWYDIQIFLRSKKHELAAASLPEYSDADQPHDDTYQGFQSWHVQSYLDECLWPAYLRSKLPELFELQRNLNSGITQPLDAVSFLEDLAT